MNPSKDELTGCRPAESSTCISICRWICTKNASAEMFLKQNFSRTSKRESSLLSAQRFTLKTAICLRMGCAWHSIKLHGCTPKQQLRSASRFVKIIAKFKQRGKRVGLHF